VALPVFDATKHHIGLGTAGQQKGFLIEGGYREMLQNAPRISEFGSPNDLITTPSLSRWTMDDFLGGAFWPTWQAVDGSTFADCKGLYPTQWGRTLRTIPPLSLWDDETGGTSPGTWLEHSLTANAHLVTFFANRVVRTKISDHTRTEMNASAITQFKTSVPGTDVVHAASPATGFLGGKAAWESQSEYGYPVLWVPYQYDTDGSGLDRFGWARYRTDTWAAVTHYHFVTGTNVTFVGANFDGIVPVFFRNDYNVYTATFNVTETTAPVLTKIGRTQGIQVDSVAYNGLVYILHVDTSSVGRISTTDGSAVTDLVTLPFSVYPFSINVYGGRIYITTGTVDDAGNHLYGQIFELTGSTLRLVKSFQNEYVTTGAAPYAFLSSGVYEGLLWVGSTSNGCLLAYDLTTDALYGVSENQRAGTLVIYDLVPVGRDLFAFGRDSNSSFTGWYRVGRSSDTVSSWSGSFTTGDFGSAVEPGLDKRWSECHLLSRFDTANPTVEYSIDGGTNWTSASVVVTTSGAYKHTVADLSPAAVSRQIRLRFTFPRSTSVSGFAELIAFTMSFSFLETGQRSWQLTITDAEMMEDLQGGIQSYNVDELADQLWSWANNRDELVFVDLHGDSFNVQLLNLTEHLPQIGDKTSTGYEGYYSLTLVEV
jgi:hypothetical protein